MAVDIEKFPTYTGTGLGNFRLSQSYSYLVNTAQTQTEATRLNDDSICFSTSSGVRNYSASCTKAYYEISFQGDYTDPDAAMNAVITRNLASNNDSAGNIMYNRTSYGATDYSLTSNTGDYCANVLAEYLNSYGVSGNVASNYNAVQFVTGFSFWQTIGTIHIIVATYDSTNERFVIQSSNGYMPIEDVTYNYYKTNYQNNPNKIPVGAYLSIKTYSGNYAPHITPWNGYKMPNMSYTDFEPTPWNNTNSKRLFSMSDTLSQTLYSFGGGYSMNNVNAGINGCPSTAPLVDFAYSTYANRRWNGAPRLNQATSRNMLVGIRGGRNCYQFSRAIFTSDNHLSDVQNGFITIVNVDMLINAAATYGILIATDTITPPSTSTINSRAKLKTWAQNNVNSLFMPLPERNKCYAGLYRELNDFLENCTKEDSDYFPSSDGDLNSMLNNPDLSFDHSSGGGGSQPTPSIDDTPLNDVTLNTLGVFNRSFAVSQANMRDLADYIYNADDTIVESIYKSLKFMGDNPSNGLISLSLTPFNIPDFTGATTLQLIKLGRQTTPVYGYVLPSSITSLFDFGEIELPYPHEIYGAEGISFLDREPHTELSLYIPYVGIMDLSPSQVIGNRLNVKIIIDWDTCSICGCVFINDILVTYRKGIMGKDVNMTGSERAVNNGQIMAGIINTAAGAASAYVGGTMGSPFMMANGISSALNGVNSAMNAAITPPVNYKNTGSTTSGTAAYLPPYPYVIMTYDIPIEPTNYGSTVGYACSTFGQLSNFRGFTVCEGFKSNCARTETENEMINQLLNSGVIL